MASIEVSTSEQNKSAKRNLRAYLRWVKKNLKTLLVSVLVIGLVLFAYEYIHTRNQLKQLSNPKVAAQNETQDLTGKVGKLVQLPTGETPTIATVNDVSKLKGQAFFKSAKNGDKVLIYTKANQAILYRPSTDKVIQFSTVNLGNSQ